MLYIREPEQKSFALYLEEQEKKDATIQKYLRDIRKLAAYAGEKITDKKQLILFKGELLAAGYAPSSINSILAAVNRYLDYAGAGDWKLHFLKVQHATFTEQGRDLTRADYERLVRAAQEKGNDRLTMLLQTICSTGIRVSELKAITVESLKHGRSSINSKSKIRLILLPKKLCRQLKSYCRQYRISSGSVFITKNGTPLDRSNIWKMIKSLCGSANVSASKVFPHNLRHLFARSFYERYKDIVRLADILGHSSVDTTRRYTIKDGSEQQRQIGGLGLLI
ncbi:MAG: tyrosine-type recombinase/integrase [Lachnospiraceae bacterium]|nr:tyrosine-type recombinase/integrase [Lachnospiraceae bacterium]